MENTIHIKNMVCPRCITAVKEILLSLKIPFTSVELGEVKVSKALTSNQYETLKKRVKELDFEVLESEKSATISKIKALIIEQLHYTSGNLKVNFSDFLAEKIHHDYSYLSRLFSSTEGVTIERFIAKQKIERIKEQLFYNDKTLSGIAFEMNYSSVAYLSTQFKKETGMTPSEFKKLKHPSHKNLDKI
jgi:AraC-like DNA-binding protein